METDVEAVVVGAGFAGLYMLHKLRGVGVSARAFEAGEGVGGVWHWNRYPGARCDIPVLSYSYSFSAAIRDEWAWSELYAAQPEIERYANFVADRLDVRRDIVFGTAVTAAHFDESARVWNVTTSTGAQLTTRLLMLCTGGFSAPVPPDIPGIDSFAGDIRYTALWPTQAPSLRGKRVGVIGTGSSGIQTITALGRQDEFRRLYVFQRTANYSAPSHNRPLTAEDLEEFRRGYEEYHARTLDSGSGTYNEGPEGPVADLDDAAFDARMKDAWSIGGPSSLLGVTDLVTNEGANERVAEFIRERIRERVDDPRVAEALSPRGHFVGARRTVYENGYFEVFNNPKVELVDVVADPIRRIVPSGVELSTRTIGLDTLVFATGFDSGTGPLLRIDITTSSGTALRDLWAEGPVTYLGLMVSGLPNLFTVAGPGSPSIRSNVITSIEQHVDWIADLLRYMRDQHADTVEPSARAARHWSDHVAAVADSTLITRHDNQYLGSNIPGKPRVFLAYIGGVNAYRRICDDVARRGYEGLVLRSSGTPLPLTCPEWSGPTRGTDDADAAVHPVL